MWVYIFGWFLFFVFFAMGHLVDFSLKKLWNLLFSSINHNFYIVLYNHVKLYKCIYFCTNTYTECKCQTIVLFPCSPHLGPYFIGPCPHRDRDYCIGSSFWKFYLIRTNFTLGELVSLVKVFRLFRLEWIFLVFRVWTQ